MPPVFLPEWANQMRNIFRSQTISQFIITGNVNDLVLYREDMRIEYYSLKAYLNEVLFAPFDVVLFYDRGHGIQLIKGGDRFYSFLQIFDKFHGSRFSSDSGVQGDPGRILEAPGLLPRAPEQALELIDRFLHNVANTSNGTNSANRSSVAVVIDYANFIIPRGESMYLSGEIGVNLIKILNWGKDPSITSANIISVLLAENLMDLNEFVTESPYNAKIYIRLPQKTEIEEYLTYLLKDEAGFQKLSEVEIPLLAEKLIGLNRINIKSLILRALRNNEPITFKYLTKVKKEIIEKEAADKLEFIESNHTLDDIAGHREAKKWLKEDAWLLKKGAVNALPMGYLVTGRIGTGKTFLIECFAGECGIPFVALKNFREKWVGATEGNFEKIFHILHALGQVVVFIDEADQATGRRNGGEGDSGLSGRIYGMLAKEMAQTDNRGKILWIFATSRPDLLEVDLKRQGRLDVHIPLFPPVAPAEVKELLLAVTRKLKVHIKEEELPELSFPEPISGNELEGLVMRAVREYELQSTDANRVLLPELIKRVNREFRPSSHQTKLEFMDLQAVKECTDDRFLPERFRNLDKTQIEKRLAELSGMIDPL